jgi:hypothetical protein
VLCCQVDLPHVKVHHLVDVIEVSIAGRELASLPQRHIEWSKITHNRATTSILDIVDPSTLSQDHKAYKKANDTITHEVE